MKKTVLLLSLMVSFVTPVLTHAQDGIGNSEEFMASLESRIQSVAAMPQGEKRSANLVLVLSDVMAYACDMAGDLNKHYEGSFSGTYARSESVYRQYRSWSHPQVAAEISSLRQSLGQFQSTVKELSSASSTMRQSVGGLASALAEKGQAIRDQYKDRPIGPITANVIDWTNSAVASFANMANQQELYSNQLLRFVQLMDRNEDPGSLATELIQLEEQIRSFQPVNGYSYKAIAEIFRTNSQNIRSQYSGLN